MTEFFTKYPDADPSRFVFKNGKVWFKLNPDNEYRLLDVESDTYQRTPSWTKYLTSYKERGFGIWFADGTVQPYKKNTTMKDINKFKLYVTEDKYFEVSLPSDVWSNEFDQGSKEINMWLSERPKEEKVRNYRYSKNSKGYITGITYQKVTGQSPNDINDYKMFIATTTNGLTKIGQKLLQQSIESYVYAVLGAQAKTRWSIVGEGAKSLQTQEVFRTIVKGTIAQSDVMVTLSNMRTAIASTNVVLNMAISPGMILVPSNLIIQKEKIPGYNNVLTLATDKMKFGKSTDVNYKAPIVTMTTQVTPKPKTQVTPKTTQANPKTTQANNPKTPSVSVASEILGVTMIVGFLYSKYIF